VAGRALVIAVVAVVAAAGAITAPVLSAGPAVAASGSDWDPGYIVSDANFYDGSALNASGVQNFLQSRNSGCLAGATCLLNFTQSTPSMPGTAYCSPLSGVAGESAASIIARVGAACRISQKTLLVLVEKEQGLISARAPSQYALTHPTGFSCPDTAPCDPAYAGFFYQIYYGARQFQIYRAFPNSFNYKARAVNNVLFSPSACGSAPVYIANDATAALYIYTPYQPNAAALANMYGTGDSCSSYGNRNFWRLWSDWFGSPTGGPLTLVQVSGQPQVYLIGSGRRYTFPNPEMLAQYANFGTPVVVSQTQLNAYPDSGPVQRAIADTNGAVWMLDSGWRFHFVSCQQLVDFGMGCSGFPTISASVLASKFVSAGDLRNLVQLPDRGKWLMQDGIRREVPDPSVLARYGISASVSGLSNFSIGSVQLGPPVVGAGLFTDGANYRTVGATGVAYDFAPGSLANGLGYRIQPESYQRLPVSSGQLPARIATGALDYLLTQSGLLQVSSSTYGGASLFSPLSTGTIAGVPQAGTATGAHFVRAASSTQTLLASGGYLTPVADSDVSWYSTYFGMSARIWIVADAALTGIDRLTNQPYTVVRASGTTEQFLVTGQQRYPIPPSLVSLYAQVAPVQDISLSQLNAYTLSRPAQRGVRGSDGAYYLLDAGKVFRFTGCAQVADYGMNCDALPLVSTSQLGHMVNGGTLQALSRLGDGSTWLLQGGQRRETPVPSVLAVFGIPSTVSNVSNDLLAERPVGEPVLGGGVITDGQGNFRAVGSAGIYSLTSAAAAGQITASSTHLQAASFALAPAIGTLPLRATSDGRYLIAVDGGWLAVSQSAYGASNFAAIPTKAWTGVATQGTDLSAHFIRERSSPKVYLASGGVLTWVIDENTLRWISATYGVPGRVWVSADGAIQDLPH
jgi:hypothetical protein